MSVSSRNRIGLIKMKKRQSTFRHVSIKLIKRRSPMATVVCGALSRYVYIKQAVETEAWSMPGTDVSQEEQEPAGPPATSCTASQA
jgi:hypothetical protein